MPASPPLIPTSTLSSTTSGAAVIEWPDRVVANRDDPPFTPAACVQRYEIAVERADIDHVVEDRHATVDARKPEVQHAPRNRSRPLPQRPAAFHAQRNHRRRTGRDIHHAVHDDRRAFQRTGARGLIHPHRPERGHVGRRNLRERRMPV